MLPYVLAARDYLDAGWSPIPLPPNEKHPVPEGFTGASGTYVDELQIKRWLKSMRFQTKNHTMRVGNIALRLPDTVIGVDVDAYGEKKGDQTFAAALDEWGELPDTWVSTSRTDGVSGIRFFRIPNGLAWPGELPQGKGVELLRWDHRYAIVAPSVHDRTGKQYGWYHIANDRLVAVDGEIPNVDELPELPEQWVEGLTSGRKWVRRATANEMGDDECRRWLADRNNPDAPCDVMSRTIQKYSNGVRLAGADGGAHDAVRDAIWAVAGDSAAGHSGVSRALNKLRRVFLEAVKDRRGNERIAKQEWARAVVGGIQKVAAEGEPDSDDPCETLSAPRRTGPIRSKDIVYDLSDIGNAERFLRAADNRARWVPEHKAWYTWDGQRWTTDSDGQVERWAVKAANSMDEELAFLEGDGNEELVKAFRAHRKATRSVGRLEAMVRVARGKRGVPVSATDFDANPNLLTVGNGTLELLDNKVKLRPESLDDLLTLRTRTPYLPKETSPLWEDYLDKFMPDLEVREWMQALVGYSLLGANPEQLLIIGLGGTGTGKTTLSEGILAALGEHAGPLLASVLRGSSDDKPRPDVLKALPRRIVIAEELSEFQHLHVDQVKRLTGSATVSARGMSSNVFIERTPAFTPWLMTNDVPTIEGGDAALRNRLLVVPFSVASPRNRANARKRDAILRDARPAILAWAVRGYVRYARGDIDLRALPAGALEANGKFAANMSEFHTFLNEMCDFGETYIVQPIALYEAYQLWCSRTGIRDPMSMTKFGRRIGAMGYEKTRERIDGKQVWHYVGITLTNSGKVKK